MNLIKILLIHILLTGFQPITREDLTGKWLMQKVIQDGKDVTSEHDPHNERYIIFKGDGTFESGGKPFGKNTGEYRFNSEDKALFLDSDAGPEDDSQWKVSIKENRMHWQGFGTEWAEGFEIIHLRENH